MTATGAQSVAIDDATELVSALECTRGRGMGLIGNVRVPGPGATEEEGFATAHATLERTAGAPGYVMGLGGPLPYAASEAWLDGVVAAARATAVDE